MPAPKPPVDNRWLRGRFHLTASVAFILTPSVPKFGLPKGRPPKGRVARGAAGNPETANRRREPVLWPPAAICPASGGETRACLCGPAESANRGKEPLFFGQIDQNDIKCDILLLTHSISSDTLPCVPTSKP
jgi:hypothetical protein